MKFIQLLTSFIFLLSCNSNQLNQHSTSNELGLDSVANTYSVTAEDTSMKLAISQAKWTIDDFDRALKLNNSSYSGFALKKRYKTPDNGGEHIWIAGIVPADGNYKGFVNNDAEKTTEVKYGDTVIVRKEEITDWMYLDKNVLRGGYTIRVVRNRLSKPERIEMDERLGFKVED